MAENVCMHGSFRHHPFVEVASVDKYRLGDDPHLADPRGEPGPEGRAAAANVAGPRALLLCEMHFVVVRNIHFWEVEIRCVFENGIRCSTCRNGSGAFFRKILGVRPAEMGAGPCQESDGNAWQPPMAPTRSSSPTRSTSRLFLQAIPHNCSLSVS